MSKTRSLKAVARYETISQRQLLTELSKAQSNLQEQAALSEQLNQYMADYARINQPGNGSTNVWTLQNGSRFAGDLQSAIELQAERLSNAELDLEQARERLSSHSLRQKSIEGLIEDAAQTERQEAENIADKEAQDQWTAQHFSYDTKN